VVPVSPLTPGIIVESFEVVAEPPVDLVMMPQPTYQEDVQPPGSDSPTSIYEARRMEPSLSSVSSMHEFENPTQLTVSKTKRRPVSLISRWAL
jgi:hypothetical protein